MTGFTTFRTSDRESGNNISQFSTREEAEEAIAQYEEQDKKDGTYEPNFYDIIEKLAIDTI